MKSLLLLFLLLPVFEAAAATSTKAGVTESDYGKCDEGPVHLYTLTNSHGLSVSIMDFGATVVKVITPDRTGKLEDIALGFDDPQTYAAAKLNFGTMGRYINRIGGGQITLDGSTYQLTKNNGANTMHGGKLGFNRHLWKADLIGKEYAASVRFMRTSPDGEEGFPGNLTVSVEFHLSNTNHLDVSYIATTDKPTVVNLSNHTLFNLSGVGNGDVLGDIVTVKGSAITPIDATSVPTGEIKSVEGTPYDLRRPTKIGDRIPELAKLGVTPAGYDINYVLNEKGSTSAYAEAGEIYDPKSGRDLVIMTTQPGAQFYTGNLFDGTLVGKGGIKYTQYCALSLESQHYPASPNHPNFPSTVLRPGQTYNEAIEYRFTVKQ